MKADCPSEAFFTLSCPNALSSLILRDQAGEDSMGLLEGGRMMAPSLVGTMSQMVNATSNRDFLLSIG